MTAEPVLAAGATPTTADVLIAGDSFTAKFSGWKMWPDILSERLGITMDNRAVSGTGYVTTPIPENRFSRQLRLPSSLGNPKMVVIMGSPNDRTVDKSFLHHVSMFTIALTRAAYPNSRFLVIGPQWCSTAPISNDMFQTRDSVRASLLAIDYDYWIDPLFENWFPTNQPQWIQPDNFHPNALGQVHIADLLEARFRTLLKL